MKLFASICGVAALMTAAVNFRILSRFDLMFSALGEPLPALAGGLLWGRGALPTGLLVASAVVVLIGLVRKSNRWMLAGGVSGIALMFAAATVVPAALMVPVSNVIQKVETGRPPADSGATPLPARQ